MYFTNITKLKEDIIEKRFSEKDRFIYILVYIILTSIFLELTLLPSTEVNYEPSIIDYRSAITSIIITFVGTYFIYKANGGVEGNDFAGKYFSIKWVRSIRVTLFFIPISIVFFILESFLLKVSKFNNEISVFLLSVGLEFAIYFYTYKDVLEINAKKA